MKFLVIIFGIYYTFFSNFSISALASNNEVLPTYHWAYEYLEELHAHGICLDLLQMNKPYNRGDVAKSLKNAVKHLNSDSFCNSLLLRLTKEFESDNLIHDDFYDSVDLRSNIRSDFVKEDEKDAKYRGIYRAGFGTNVTDNFYISYSTIFDQYDYNNTQYVGHKWRGVSGYTEQAYINTKWKKFSFKIGRDFLKWGAGYTGTLIFSNIAQPIDQFKGVISHGPFKFSFIAAELDEFPAVTIDSTDFSVKRYLTGHRLDVSLFSGRLQFAVSELLLYGGVGESLKLAYLNPVMFYKGAHKNRTTRSGNILPTVDCLIYPRKNWQIYTSVLIDDIQLEKTGPVDLEPNEIGWIFGTKWADAFKVSGLSLNLEYVQIANRTYKTPYPLETFVHKGRPLGYPLGNDLYYWEILSTYWLRDNWWVKFNYSVTNNGEGSIYSPWDAPWFNFTIQEGYDEPFPTGMVEKINKVEFESSWFYNNFIRLYINLSNFNINNRDNINNKKSNFWEWKFRLELNWRNRFRL